MKKIYSHIFIDEVQDMSGYDLEIIKSMMKSETAVTIVGDGKQAVFQTNYSAKNKGKGGSNIWNYFQQLATEGFAIIEKQNISRRFNWEICNFANRVYPNENNIGTCMTDATDHDGVYLVLHKDVNKYYDTFSPTVLRCDRRSDTDGYNAMNFGECKGQTFNRVLIYPNGPLRDFLLKGKPLNSPIKYYVAVTRPRYSIAFVIEKKMKEDQKYEVEKLDLKNGDEITMWHLIPDAQFDLVKGHTSNS